MSSDGQRGEPVTALVVEDDALVAEMVAGVLAEAGYRVIGKALDGAQAVELAAQLAPGVILLDLQLPVLDGLEAARRINQVRPAPLVVLTAYDRPELLEEAARAGVGAFLVKPPNRRELERAISVARARFADLQELRRLNARLAQEKAERASIIETSADGFYLVDREGRILEANQAFVDLLGYTREELLALRVPDVEAAESPAEIERHIQAIVRTGKDRFETRHRCKDGRIVEVEVSATYLAEQDRLVVFGRDITDRKRGEAALRESEARHRNYIANTPYAVFVADEQGRYLQVNPAASRITGYSEQELLSMRIADLQTEDGQAEGLRHFQQVVGEGRAHGELQFRHQSGEARWWSVSAVRLSDTRFLGFCNDITDRKEIEEAIRLNETRLRSIVDLQQRWADPEQELLELALEEAVKLTGSALGHLYLYSEERREFTLNSWSRQVAQECRIAEPQTVCPLETTGVWGEAVRQRKPIVINDFQAPHPLKRGCPAGHAVLSSFLSLPVTHENRIVAVIGVGNKKTPYLETDRLQLTLLMDSIWKLVERKRAEAEKAKLQAQLQQAMKMEAVGRLAGGVAHDFNNLLTGITGNVQLALMDLRPGDPLEESLLEIGKAADSAASLTRQLLAFSRKQLIEPRVLDLNALIRSMQRMLTRLIGEDVALEIVPGDDLGAVKVDPGQLEQILVNLSINARDAMPQGGTLVIETANVELDEEYCRRHPDARPGSYVRLAVRDTGQGMSEEVQRHLFEPFFTTKPKGRGTGLGLATIYGAVKQSGGDIEVSTAPGAGTTFAIYLPRVAEPVEPLAPDSRALELVGGDETVLVVEDQRSVLEIVVTTLSRLGYKVLHAADGEQALLLAEGYREPIHALLTDVVMPGMNGRQLAERLVKSYPAIRVLYTSGYTEDTIAHHGVIDEGLEFIAKPYTPQALARKLRRVLDR